MNKNQNILIVGLGLIGGSYAKKLSKEGYKVFAIDKDQSAIEYAILNGFIRNSFLSDAEMINIADLIILCIYPKAIASWIRDNKKSFKDGVLITDVAGIKRQIVMDVSLIENKNFEFIGSHPIAGREKKGVNNALEDLFIDANFMLTPYGNSDYAINEIKSLASVLGFSNIEVVTPEYHDEVIGYLSQLPHAIAVALMNSHDSKEYIKYTGDSFRDLTRIAKINESLWSELFILNKDYLISEIDSFINELEKIKTDIKTNAIQSLENNFRNSTIRRKQFDKK